MARRRRASYGAVAALLCAGLVGCQAGPPAPGSAAPGSSPAEAPTSGAPSHGATPGPTAPVDDGPLPEPVLGSVDAIVDALSDPAQAEQVVVSMLDELGIGLYQPNGTPIRVGTESTDEDFFMFEPEARGLASMLRSRDDPEDRISFRDLHATLAGLGFDASAEELATAYADAYAAQPEAPVSRFVAALGPIDVDGRLPSLEAWLLVLDGFVPPNAAATAVAMAGDAFRASAQGQGGWGTARSRVQIVSAYPIPDDAELMLRLHAIAYSFRITVQASPATVHEGHGSLGSTTQVRARTKATAEILASPFNGAMVLPVNPSGGGVDVEWAGDATAVAHGFLADATTTANAAGEATNTYTPKQEDAAGQGIERDEIARIHAGYTRRDMLVNIYGSWVSPYVSHLVGYVRTWGFLNIGWHEKVEAVIKIVWTDTYDGVADTITFLGDLTGTEPDPVSGGVMYVGRGTATGSRAGWAACNPGIDVVPSGTVDAAFQGMLTGTGSIMISAYADAFTTLAGISTAPMEVPIVGGFAQFDTPTVGELCPHFSHGEMTVTALSLPNP